MGKADFGSQSISWGQSDKYDTGVTPSIALDNNGNVVEAHSSENFAQLWYRVGKVDFKSRTISWGKSVKYDSGKFPVIRIDDKGNVVEVHLSQNAGTLWSRVGKADFGGKSVSWNARPGEAGAARASERTAGQ